MQIALLRSANALTVRTAVLLSALAAGSKESWIQVCKVGQFKNYLRGGKQKTLVISKAMLTQMEANFTNGLHPEQPTELVIDYEHMSANPQRPEDGKAAGWYREVELREEGTELWARVEWTAPAATSIEAKEFKYFSPEFTFEYTTHNGDTIGATLLAGAITNRPFLQGMAAVALRQTSGGVALSHLMFEQRRSLVQGALRRQYASADDDQCSFDRAWVCDMDDTHVIYELDGKKHRATYTIETSGDVTLGDPEEVVTNYTPLATGESDSLASRGADPMSKNAKPITIRLRNAADEEVEIPVSAIEDLQIVKDLRVELAARPSKDAHDLLLANNVTLSGRIDQLETSQTATSERLRGEDADRAVTSLIATGKATPKQKDGLVQLFLSNKALYDTIVANAVQVVPTGEIGADAGAEVTATARVMARVSELVKDNAKLSQADAMSQVFREQPALYTEYTAEANAAAASKE